MRIKIEPIDQRTLMLLQDTAPKGVTVKLGGSLMRQDQLVAAEITFTAGVESSAIGTWLYDKIQGKSAKVSINRVRVDPQQAEITRVIQEGLAKE